MSVSLLACPLCSQPGFETLDSLCYGLISAATRQIICPVCHDVLYGLDKFTIHLFSHSVQHQETNNSLPVQRVQHVPAPVNQQPSNPSMCSANQSNASPVTKHQPSADVNVNYIAVTNSDNIGANGDKTASYSCESLKSKQFQNHGTIQILWEEKSTNNASCEAVCRSKDASFCGSMCPEDDVSNTVEKSMPSHSDSMNEPNVKEVKRNTDDKSLHSINVDKTHNLSVSNQNISVQCSAPETVQCSATNKSPMPVKDIVKCDICGFVFDDSSILVIHKQLVHSVINVRDTLNNGKPISKGCKQEKVSDEEREFPCHLCSKAFKMRGSLMVHLRVAHSSIIGTGKSLLGKVDPDSHSDERKFGCHLCSKTFRKEQHLSQHLKTHEGKQWECDVCCKMFTTKYFLKKHKRLHTGETPYSCDACGKTFTFQQSYHKHLLYHSDDKPHVCTECDRAFKELSTLHNHQRIHTGEKPFACETCGKCFRQRVSYLVHRRIHTGAMPYQCTACGKSFRYKVSQRTHKCPSQPPGTVVRQSGDLVQKLLQGAQQTMQVSSIESRTEGKNTTERTPASSDEFKNFTTQYQQQQNQFTIVMGNSIFPSGHIGLSPDTQCVDDKHSNAGKKLLSDLSECGGKNIEIAMNDKMTSTTTIDSSLAEVRKLEVRTVVDDSDKNTVRKNTSGFEKIQEEMISIRNYNNVDNKESSENSEFLHENNFCATSAKSDICLSSSNSEVFWKSSNKKQKSGDNSDLVVETTDFFTMILSPSGKSLPSPSERLKHLSLSSPVDALLSYEDDGLYQFLLNSDNPESLEKNSEVEVVHPKSNSIETGTPARDSNPLETINEESLKRLLYGSSTS